MCWTECFLTLQGEGQDSQQIPGQGGDGSFDAQIETRTRFLTMLQKHNFVALECLWLENKFRLLETVSFEFFLDLAMLRSYVSENSSYSWVRAKKKLVVEKDFDPYRAKKTLWHAFRVLEYGMQIGTRARIDVLTMISQVWKTCKLSSMYRSLSRDNAKHQWKLEGLWNPVQKEI